MAKYRLLRERLIDDHVLAPDDLHVPEPAALSDLRLAHDAAYVDAVANGTLPAAIERRIGFPSSPEMVERSQRSVGATIAAARIVTDPRLPAGLPAHLPRGTHPSLRARRPGSCRFNALS